MLPWVIVFGHVQMALGGLLWGIAAYAVFIILVRNDRYWQIGAWVSAVLFFAWDKIVVSTLMAAAGVRYSDEISESVGAEIWDINLYVIVLSIGLAFVGFVLGRWLVKRAAEALTWSDRARATRADADAPEPPPRRRP